MQSLAPNNEHAEPTGKNLADSSDYSLVFSPIVPQSLLGDIEAILTNLTDLNTAIPLSSILLLTRDKAHVENVSSSPAPLRVSPSSPLQSTGHRHRQEKGPGIFPI